MQKIMHKVVGADVTVGPYNFYALFYGEVYFATVPFPITVSQ